MKILNFGSCNIDYVYSLDHIVKIGETETTDKLELFPCGIGLNQSIAAAKKHMIIMFNPSPINNVIDEIDFGDISYLILNEVEASAISGCGDTYQSLIYLKQKYPMLKIVLTLGSDGCIYFDSDTEIYQSAFCVKAIDTTAAGDTFTGYFAAEISQGTDYQKILKTASAASAIAVSRKGAAPSIPSKSEVTAAVDELTENNVGKSGIKIKEQIINYINLHTKDGSLSDLANTLGYSASYTGSLVKKHLGTSFSDAIQTKRCKAAAKMLTSTDLKISDISERIGYENVTFFRQIFLKKYGKSPSKYRKSRF